MKEMISVAYYACVYKYTEKQLTLDVSFPSQRKLLSQESNGGTPFAARVSANGKATDRYSRK
jgi:hypothetical protein